MTARRDEALAFLRRGHEAHLEGDLARAGTSYRKALALVPDLADADHLLAVAELQDGGAGLAADRLRSLLGRGHLSAAVAINLGLARVALGQPARAATAFRRAAALDPGDGIAWLELGNLSVRGGDFRGSLRRFGRAASIDPIDGTALGNLGSALAELGDGRAARWHRRAVAATPGSAKAWINAGHGTRAAGDWSDAGRAYGRAAALEPENATALSEAIHARLQIADWKDLESLVDDLGERLAKGGAAPPFHLLALDLPAHLKRKNAERWSAQYATYPVVPPKSAPPAERLRLGYVSGDFRRHAVAYQMVELLERHDPRLVEIHGYTWATNDGSEVRARLERAFGSLVDLSRSDDEQAARRIAADEIDVLIDLSGHTYGARPGILSRRPVAVQVNYFGFPGATGAAYHDYALVDAIVAPPGSDDAYREAIVRLPGCYWPHDARRLPSPPADRSRYGLPRAATVLACFNQAYKIQPRSFDTWMQVLRTIPAAVLWLLDPGEVARVNLRREASIRGVDPSRVIFAPPLPHAEHLARIATADLAIDTLPYNAHTTSSDALAAGCPVVTQIGGEFAGRVSASMLTSLGMTEMIAQDASGYADLVIGLAADRARLAAVRERLQIRSNQGLLFDMKALCRSIEAAAIEMRRRHAEGKHPASFLIGSKLRS